MSEDVNTQAAAIGRDKDMAPAPGETKGRGRRRRKVSYLTINKIDFLDYKDVAILRRFVNDRGKMIPSRQTGNTAKQQRMVARAIRRARELALLPFAVTDFLHDRREAGGRPPRHDRGDRDRGPREAPKQAETPVESAPEAPQPVEAVVEAAPGPAPAVEEAVEAVVEAAPEPAPAAEEAVEAAPGAEAPATAEPES